MRFATRILLVGVVIALLTAGGVVGLDAWKQGSEPPEEDGAPEAGTSTAAAAGRDALLTVLPTVAHPGNHPAPAERSTVVVSAKFKPASKGRVVLLERQSGEAWQTVSSAQQDGSGTATFPDIPPPRARGQVRFRATALDEHGAPDVVTQEIDANRWRLVFGDQFDGDALDTSKWGYRQVGYYNQSGSRACSMSDERAVSVSGGTLKLQVQEDPARVGEPCYTDEYGTLDYYLNGHVATEGIFDFKYGVAAARVKFPQGRGQHGAFWLQKSGTSPAIPGDPRRSGAEIDVVEFFGEGYPEGGLASFLYYLNSDNQSEKVGGVWPKATRQLPPGDAWWRSYHVFSVQWTPKEYIFRVDGREIFRTKEGVSGVPQFVILSLLSSDWELPQLDRTTLPTTMETDWVRVWQRRKSS